MTLSPHLLTLVRDYGRNKAASWLTGEEELAIADDDLTSFLARNDVEFDELLTPAQDALRDEYIESVKAVMSQRLSGSDLVTSPLPVSVAHAEFSTLGADGKLDRYLMLSPEWLTHAYHHDTCIHRTLKECAMQNKTIEEVWPLVAAIMYELKNTWEGTALDNARKNSGPVIVVSPASSVVPAPLVPEVVKEALEALEELVAALGDQGHDGNDQNCRGCMAVKKAESAHQALREYRPAPSPSVELLREARQHLEGVENALQCAYEEGFAIAKGDFLNGNASRKDRFSFSSSVVDYLSKLNAVLS